MECALHIQCSFIRRERERLGGGSERRIRRDTDLNPGQPVLEYLLPPGMKCKYSLTDVSRGLFSKATNGRRQSHKQCVLLHTPYTSVHTTVYRVEHRSGCRASSAWAGETADRVLYLQKTQHLHVMYTHIHMLCYCLQ